ncbi:MAG: hypothetical protein U0Z53_29115 [Blastocatellia bacterium]
MNFRDFEQHAIAATSGVGVGLLVGHEDILRALSPILVTVTTYLVQSLIRRKNEERAVSAQIAELILKFEERGQVIALIQQQSADLHRRLLNIEVAVTQPGARARRRLRQTEEAISSHDQADSP